MPEGLFVDETAIGYNAALIGETGYSEDGSYLPLFTNSVGDYRGPVMIYTVVLLFKLFGVSIPLLRGISALFHTIALLAMLLTVRKMFSRHPAVSLYMIVAGTLLP